MKDALRNSVKEEYAQKLQQQQGFCAHQLESEFGYSQQELESLPGESVDSSFGCANPLSFGAVKAGDTVVDLGSGAGMDVILAAQKVGPTGRVVGVDMTDAMIEKAQANIRQAGLETVAEIRRGYIESLPLESDSADWVISNCVVSLSPDKESVFAEVFRVLKPGGKMLLTDLVMEAVPWWLKKLIAIKSPASAEALGLDDYLKVVKDSGLSNIKLVSKLDYDQSMLSTLAHQELAKNKGFIHSLLTLDSAQVSANLLSPLVKPMSRIADNKVASIKVYGEKPSV